MDWSFISGKIASLIEESIAVALAEPGKNDHFQDGFIAKKTMPCTIIAQAYEGVFGIQPEGQTMVRTAPGGAYIVGANTAITIGHYAARSANGIMKARWVHVHFTIFGTLDLLSLFTLPLTVSPKIASRFGTIIEDMLALKSDKGSPIMRTAARHMCAFRILEMICSIAAPSPEAAHILHHSAALAPALTFIRKELGRRIEVKDIAESAGLSVSHLHSLCKNSLGLSPMEYVKEIRLTECRYRIAATDATLSEIARAYGFADQFHFSRSFKNRFGITPSLYRKQYTSDM